MESISCIIPVYGLTVGDNMSYFKELLLSLSVAIKQFEGNVEIVIVNDDVERISKQDVEEVCQLTGVIEIVKYLENQGNKGQAFSRNVGASNSSGHYLHFIDQDDYVSENFYSSLFPSSKIADVCLSVPFFCKDGVVKKAYTKRLLSAYHKATYIDNLWFLLFSNVVYSPGQVVMTRRCFEESGGFPILKNRGADDFALFYNMIFNKTRFSVSFCRERKFYYRIHSQQNSVLSSTSLSVREFLSSQKQKGFKQKLIFMQKTQSRLSILGILFYITYFKRA